MYAQTDIYEISQRRFTTLNLAMTSWMALKTQDNKRLHQNKTLLHAKTPPQSEKGQPTEWEKVNANQVPKK